MVVLVLLVVLVTALCQVSRIGRCKRLMKRSSVWPSCSKRIGIASCRETLLQKAEFVFRRQGCPTARWHPTSYAESKWIAADSIVLGDQRFDLVLSDENAKLNLNTVNFLTAVGRSRDGNGWNSRKVQEMLRRMLPVSDSNAVQLRPAQSSSDNSVRPAYRSWGEVFDFKQTSCPES